MTKYIVICTLLLSFFFVACNEIEGESYIIIKDENGSDILGDTIPVSLNNHTQTFIDVSYPSGDVYYLRQIDGGEITNIESVDGLDMVSHNHIDGNWLEKVVVTTSFADSLVQVGSVVRISARFRTDMVAYTNYKVTE